MRRLVRIASALAALVSTAPLIAQTGQSSPQAPPLYIAATAVGETRVTPDRAQV